MFNSVVLVANYMSDYICQLCNEFKTKIGTQEVIKHIKEKHGIQVREGTIEHVLVSG